MQIHILPPLQRFWPYKSGLQQGGTPEIACHAMRLMQVGPRPGLMGGSAYKSPPGYKRLAGLGTPRGPRFSTSKSPLFCCPCGPCDYGTSSDLGRAPAAEWQRVGSQCGGHAFALKREVEHPSVAINIVRGKTETAERPVEHRRVEQKTTHPSPSRRRRRALGPPGLIRVVLFQRAGVGLAG